MKYDKLFNQITITECTPTMVKMLGSIHLKLEYAGESLATTCYGKCDYNENTYSMYWLVKEKLFPYLMIEIGELKKLSNEYMKSKYNLNIKSSYTFDT